MLTLSHYINEKTPIYKNKGGFKREKLTSINNGDTANTEKWFLNNHLGTHIDFPNHFFENGKTSTQFFPPIFITKNYHLIDFDNPIMANEIISLEKIQNKLVNVPVNTEVLFLRTGFEKYRETKIYWNSNPGFCPSVGKFLKKKFKNIKFFGFDSISLTSVNNGKIGAEAHKVFLDEPNPILIIEDMKLSKYESKSKFSHFVITYFPVTETDGTPVNCFLTSKI